MTNKYFGVTLIFTIFNKTVKYDSYLKVLQIIDDTKYRGGKVHLICSVNNSYLSKQVKYYPMG